eukprot:CAMPEP_0118931702 /NCGR_PEP_ID=MMETSP1169-20130426/7953_1 /TAXON_ID=36882 /ORGANISM="Pyramimonas obovata, Strain CCMP722" /LENGTH=205 /DNA_ID=CAMNT_0006874231 /DNA_START=45 /DNA_END=659 /DNA_ORIENTATION=-
MAYAPQPYGTPGGYNPYVTGAPPPPQPQQMQPIPTSYPAAPQQMQPIPTSYPAAPPQGYYAGNVPMAPPQTVVQAPAPPVMQGMVAPPTMVAPTVVQQTPPGCWCCDEAPEMDECPKCMVKLIGTPPAGVAYVLGVIFWTGLQAGRCIVCPCMATAFAAEMTLRGATAGVTALAGDRRAAREQVGRMQHNAQQAAGCTKGCVRCW